MKLRKSIDALNNAFTELLNNDGTLGHQLGELMIFEKARGKVKNAEKFACYVIWNNCVSHERKNQIIAESVPRDTWVGGYPPNVDSVNIDTLLRNSLIHQFVCTVLLDNNIETISNNR
jgi:hypothetical protein